MSQDDILCIGSSIKMPLLTLPTKTILVRLPHGVVAISPSHGLADVEDRVEAFGKVTDIVAPNLFHNTGIAAAHELFPKAVLWGVPGFHEKLPDIPWQQTFMPESWPYGAELELHPIGGMPRFNEVVMLHRPSRTLIATDLCFNIVDAKGLGPWIVFRMFGTYRRFAVSRFFMRMVKDRPAMVDSLRDLMRKEFDNIIMAHGENVYGDAKQQLAAALQERGVSL